MLLTMLCIFKLFLFIFFPLYFWSQLTKAETGNFGEYPTLWQSIIKINMKMVEGNVNEIKENYYAIYSYIVTSIACKIMTAIK